MMSMISVFQTANRFADVDMFAQLIIFVFILMILWNIKKEEEGGITGMCQYLYAGLLCILHKYATRNNNTQQCDSVKNTIVNTKKENKKKKVLFDNVDRDAAKQLEDLEVVPLKRLPKIEPPVLEEKKKKPNKKKKEAKKNNLCKENRVPSVMKEKGMTEKGITKMYESLRTAKKFNLTSKELYDQLFNLTLTENDLMVNHYPAEKNYYNPNIVAESTHRSCVRCRTSFEIINGVYQSNSTCTYHPRKAVFDRKTHMRTFPCCNKSYGSLGCATHIYHVTVQHEPRPLSRTSTKRHVRKDLLNRVYALDCEMSYTTGGLEVTRVSLVNIDGITMYDSFVIPNNHILDYNTMYSGVTKSDIDRTTVTLDDVKGYLATQIQEDTILVGHGLNNDLAALGLIHETVIDTSVLYPNDQHPGFKRSLKYLAQQHLGIPIHNDVSGHDSIEDARVSLQLALLKVQPLPSRQPLVSVENVTNIMSPNPQSHHQTETCSAPTRRKCLCCDDLCRHKPAKEILDKIQVFKKTQLRDPFGEELLAYNVSVLSNYVLQRVMFYLNVSRSEPRPALNNPGIIIAKRPDSAQGFSS